MISIKTADKPIPKDLHNGKTKWILRYVHPLTKEWKEKSITVNAHWSKKKAKAVLLQQLQEQFDRIGQETYADITLGHLIEKYREYQHLTCKQSTCTRNYHTENTFMKLFGEKTIVDRLTIRYVKDRFIKSGKAPKTLNEYRKRFIAMIKWAYENDYLSPEKKMELTEKFGEFKDNSPQNDEKYLEPEELTILLNNMQMDKWILLTKFLAYSGLRVGEVIALEAKDIDFKNHCIHITKDYDIVNRALNDTPKTSDSNRDAVMSPQLEVIAKEILTNTKEEMLKNGFRTDLFICREDGSYMSYYAYNQYIRKYADRYLGKRVTAHAMRHTYACYSRDADVPVATVSRQLGHGGEEITRRVYLHDTRQQRENDFIKLRSARMPEI